MAVPPKSQTGKAASPGLVTIQQLPAWMQDNLHIWTGYTLPTNSYRASIAEIFFLHNETGNIWTHLLGAGLFIIKFYRFLTYTPTTTNVVKDKLTINVPERRDRIAISIYYTGVVACFTLSTIFHTLCRHSEEVHNITNRIDLLGGVFVIWATSIAATHFEFRDQEPTVTYVYWLMCTTFGGLTATFLLNPSFKSVGPMRHVKLFWIWMGLGASTFIPLLHGLIKFGYNGMNQRMGLNAFLRLAMWNGTGAVIYAVRVPERIWPGRFDYLGQSHQIMHGFLVLGALSYERGLLGAMKFWRR
jgi:adiponectin receptor